MKAQALEYMIESLSRTDTASHLQAYLDQGWRPVSIWDQHVEGDVWKLRGLFCRPLKKLAPKKKR